MLFLRILLMSGAFGYVLAIDDEDEEKFFEYPPMGKYPYVALVTSKLYMCTGVILTPAWVLTAAHCVYDRRKKKFIEDKGVKVYAAVEEAKNPNNPEVQNTISEKVYGHPKFTFLFAWQQPSKWDVALIKVKDPFDFDNFTSGAKISGKGWPQFNSKDDGQTCTSLGYGSYKSPYQTPSRLKARNVTARHGETACPCALRFQWKRMVCVHTNKTEPKHAMMCRGDDGGPLVCNGEVVALSHMVWNKASCSNEDYPKQKCAENPSPGMDMYFFLCVVNDWMREVAGNVIPPQPPSCDAPRHSCLHCGLLLILPFLLTS